MVDSPGLWDLLGAKSSLRELSDGFTAELAIPLSVLGWTGSPTPSAFQLNVRIFGLDESGARVALQWVDDPQNTAVKSHEMLGFISVMDGSNSSLEAAALSSKSNDRATESTASLVLKMIADEHASDASALLVGSPDPRMKALLSVVYEKSGQPDEASSILQQLSRGDLADSARWARQRLELGSTAISSFSAADPVDPEIERSSNAAEQLLASGQVPEAIVELNKIAAAESAAIPLRTWAMFQVQKAQRKIGKRSDALTTGLGIQRGAPDGDPARRASFYETVEGWYSPEESLVRAKAIADSTVSQKLSEVLSAQLTSRTDSAGCWQTLELGELLRVEGFSEEAGKKFSAAADMTACPREDRAWARLLLQRAEFAAGQREQAFATATRIEAEFADEWETRFASLQEARQTAVAGHETAMAVRLVGHFKSSLRETVSNGNSQEIQRAKLLIRSLDQRPINEGGTGISSLHSPVSGQNVDPTTADAATYRLYQHLFRHVAFLKKKADEKVSQGQTQTQLRQVYQIDAALTQPEAAVLESTALACVAKLDDVNVRMRPVIRAARDNARLQTAARTTATSAHSTLAAFKGERLRTVAACRDELRASFGEQRFSQFETFLRNRAQRRNVSLNPIEPGPNATVPFGGMR